MRTMKEIADKIRRYVIIMLEEAGSGHPAGSLGMADIFTALYFGQVMVYDPKKPKWKERDYLVVSNGHVCPVLYACMSEAGFFPHKELLKLRKSGSKLQGHPHKGSLPGLENSSGPLGSGLSQAAGMALGLKMDEKPNRVFCMLSDAEQDEGNTWEGAMFASKYKLNNLTCVMDRNKIQLSGNTKEIMPLKNLKKRYKNLGWDVRVIDGHNFKQILRTLRLRPKKPLMIIANTIPGKGVSFMENRWEWHGKPLTMHQAENALVELENER